jgi:protein phosphatase
MREIWSAGSGLVKFSGKSDKGISRRQNEDAYCIIGGEDGEPLVLAVADGMGGHKAGDVASRMAIEAIRESMASEPLDVSSFAGVAARLKKIIWTANDRIFRKSLADQDCAGMGTTLVVAVVTGGAAILAHVGDSCAYLFRGNAITKITTDHTYVEELIKIGSLTQEEARLHPKRNYITKAVGCLGSVEADIYNVSVMQSDRIVLCTDGLSKMLSDDEILETVYSSSDPEEICAKLIERSNSKGGYDNITALAFLNAEPDTGAEQAASAGAAAGAGALDEGSGTAQRA